MSNLMTELLNLVGNESGDGYFGPQSLEEEMNAEISLESEIDAAIFDAEAAAVTAATAIAENIYVAMAEKECAMEGARPLDVYRSFGLEGALVNYVGQEAISDVVKRRAYSGMASIKSLINTIIAWFKRILGLSTNTKKIFKSLGDKAKKIRKDVVKARASFNRVQTKEGEDREIDRELPEYIGVAYNANSITNIGLNTVITFYTAVRTRITLLTNNVAYNINYGTNANSGYPTNQAVSYNPRQNSNGSVTTDGRRADNRYTEYSQMTQDNATNPNLRTRDTDTLHLLLPTDKETWSERISEWIDNKNEEHGTDLFTRIMTGLDRLYTERTGKHDVSREVERGIKALERIRTNAERDYRNADTNARHEGADQAIAGILNQFIYVLNTMAMYMNMFAKFYVKVADQLFTDAKWLIAKSL